VAGKISDLQLEVPDESALAYSIAQAARRCNLSERTLRGYIARGELKVSRAGRRVLIRPERLEEFLLSLEVDGRSPIDEAARRMRRKQP